MAAEKLQQEDEISIKELIEKISAWVAYLKTKWLPIVMLSFLGGVLGAVYAWMQPITYTAKTTFVVEDAKPGGGLSGLASLAGQFGVDIGTNAGGGLISGDNIMLYFKSESLIRNVLLSPWDNKTSFADQYAKINGIKEKWEKKVGWKNFVIRTNYNGQKYTRSQDSILNGFAQKIIKENIVINKTDKKAGFIELTSTMTNEEYAKRFNNQLVDAAVHQYIKLKTDRQKKTVEKLQARADSIALLLNQKTGVSASLQTANATMDLNPMYRTSSVVQTELVLRDKTMLGSIYVEVVKNLELAKFTLSQETPVIQIVNAPLYPLLINKTSKLKTAIIVSILFGFLTIFYFIGKRMFTDLMKVS